MFLRLCSLPLKVTQLASRSALILVFLALLVFVVRCELDTSSEWSPFCEDKLYYKPYLRISQGRNGPLLRDRGPGFVDLRGMEDLYICANGLVFLYYKLVKYHGEVYDDAVMQYAAHFCGFFNGKPGPGTGERKASLLSVLLIGHPEDYRKIALQMFIAPMLDPENKTTSMPAGTPEITVTNFTSLAIINSEGECIIEKGFERARIRIRANPPDPIKSYGYAENEEQHTTLCRLDGISNMGQDPSRIPLEGGAASLPEVLDALRYDDKLKFTGCYQYPLLNDEQIDIIWKRKEELSHDDFFIYKSKSELNPEDGSGLKFWTKERQDTYGSPLTDPDEDALGKEVVSKNNTYNFERQSTPRDPAKILAAKQALELAEIRFGLAPYISAYSEHFELAKKYGEETKVDWDAVWDFVKDDSVNQTRINYTDVLRQMSELTYDRRFEAYNEELQVKLEAAKNESQDLNSKLWAKTLEAAPKISKAEISYFRYNSFTRQSKALMKTIREFIEEFERTKKSKVVPYRVVDETFEDTLVSIKNEGTATDACLTLERRQDQCKQVKPSAERACQLAMNRLGRGKDWRNPDDAWRDDVLGLIESIFTKVCPYLEGDFALAVNRIVRGYLINEPGGIGFEKPIQGSPFINSTLQNFMANYKVTKAEDFYGPMKPKDPVWNDIVTVLDACDKDASPLKFEFSSLRSLKYTFEGKTIPENVEQADLEFAFNWAIDTNYRMFATVLGHCYGKPVTPALAKQFYDRYSEDFLDPIRPIWLNNRDNGILKTLLGQYYITGKGDLWTSQCMETVFARGNSQDRRPLRKLYVNAYSELNFFADGPLKGKRGAFL